ncbi:unnamed protein product [Blepharisma stoltei]|uniref:Importin N-terminal domain-containing protein n=1 Tax=Blepharisma stoltei TaxID=1481888 RepID=A0AAU9JDK4_9CILI|nr:unnamed protein product [Blepharisma stoltei]
MDLALKIASLLESTFKATSTDQVRSAEAELETLSQDKENFLQSLLYILTSSQAAISEKVKISASVNLKNFLLKVLNEENLNSVAKEHIAKSIFNALVAPESTISLQNSLGLALVPLFMADLSDPQQGLMQITLPLVANYLGGEKHQILGSFVAIRSIYGVFSDNESLFPVFKHLLDPLLAVAQKEIYAIQKGVYENNEYLLLDGCEIINEWAITLGAIFEYFELISKPSFAEISTMQNLAETFKSILQLSITSSQELICLETKIHHLKLNEAKTQILTCIVNILGFLSESNMKVAEDNSNAKTLEIPKDMQNSPFINIIMELVSPLTQTIHSVISLADYEELLQTENISNYLNEILLILCKACYDNRFLSFFLNSYKQIIVEIILPIIKSSQNDLEKFELMPEEFVLMSKDMCDQQQSDILKITSALLLKTISEKIDGSLSFAVNFVSELIDKTVVKGNPESFSLLTQFKNASILYVSETLAIDTSLSVLCILSHFIKKRPDLSDLLDAIIGTHLSAFSAVTDGLILHRLCLIVHYFCVSIFTHDTSSFINLVQILLNCCNPSTTPKATNIQACETLGYMLQEDTVCIRLDSLLSNIIITFIHLIPIQNNKEFFEAIQEVVAGNTDLVYPHLEIFVNAIVQKIQSEVMRLKQENNEDSDGPKEKSSVVISKCWNIIRMLLEARELETQQILDLEKTLTPLFNFMTNPKEIDFDDEIVIFEIGLMKKLNMVTTIGWALFPYLNLIQEKYEGTFIQLFPLMNCYLHYGREVIAANPNMLTAVVSMCRQCLFSSYKGKPNEGTNSEAALILQQILYTYVGQIDFLLGEILAMTMNRLTEQINHDFFRVRLLGVALAAFAYNCQMTFQILNSIPLIEERTSLDLVIDLTVLQAKCFTHQHDKKVTTLALTTILSQEVMPETVSSKISEIFQTLIEILIPATTKNAIILKKQDMMIYEMLKSMSSQQEENEESDEYKKMLKNADTEEMEATLAIASFMDPLQDLDEYEQFRGFIKRLSTASPNALSFLMAKLEKEKVAHLSSILQFKRVKITGFSAGTTDVRRVVKAKKKNKPN